MTAAHEEDTSATQSESFFTLRSRAYELADTGRYKDWNQIAYALLAEGFLPPVITRLDHDAQAVMLVTRTCRRAIAAHSPARSGIRKWFGL